MVNLARSAALAYAITSLISGLSSLFQLSCMLLHLNREAYQNHRQGLVGVWAGRVGSGGKGGGAAGPPRFAQLRFFGHQEKFGQG